MTRARARALETEVTSLLSQFHFDEHETWLLPQTKTLCVLRYQGVSHGEARKQGELEAEDMREDGEEISQVAGWPDDPDEVPDDPDNWRPESNRGCPEAGSSGPRPGSSGHTRTSGPRPEQIGRASCRERV